MNENKKVFSKIGTNYFILGISAIIFEIILVNIIALIKPELLHNYNSFAILSAFSGYALPFPILLYLMRKIESETLEKHKLTIKKFLIYAAISLTLMWIGNIIGIAITTLISSTTTIDVSNPVENLLNSTDIWINLILISIIGPVFEEIMFRKLLIDRTIIYGPKISIILSALMFGLFHGNLNQFFYTFLLGGFLAYVYIKTGNILHTILLHITINLTGSVVSLFVEGCITRLVSGQVMPLDLIVVIAYGLIILTALFTGLYYLIYKYKNAKLENIKAKISLTQPFRTVILNYGMILFIGFCICKIILQLLG